MSDSAITRDVFLDTQVFDAHRFDFKSANLQLLVRLAVEGRLRVVLTTVTVAEIRSHIDRYAEQTAQQVKTVSRLTSLARHAIDTKALEAAASVPFEDYRRLLSASVDTFLTESKAEVVPLDGVSAEAIFTDYFASNPPFDDGEKKHEFPDAFAAAALQHWCASKGCGRLYVVSGDKDWRRVCAATPAFHRVPSLSELLEKFSDTELVMAIKSALTSRRDELAAFINERVDRLSFYSIDGVDAEIDQVEEATFELDDFHVLNVAGGQAQVTVTGTLRYSVLVVDDDPDSGVYDHEEHGMHYVYRRSGSVEGVSGVDVIVGLDYMLGRPLEVVLREARFEPDDIHVSLEDAYLSRDDDEDDYDNPGDMYDGEEPDENAFQDGPDRGE